MDQGGQHWGSQPGTPQVIPGTMPGTPAGQGQQQLPQPQQPQPQQPQPQPQPQPQQQFNPANPAHVGNMFAQMQTALQQANATIAALQQQLANLPQQPAAPVVNIPAPIVNVPAPVVNVQAPQPNVQGGGGGGLKPAKPEAFKGEIGASAKTFLQAARMYMALRPQDFPDDTTRIAWVLMLMQDRAAQWAQPITAEILAGAGTARSNTWATFETEFRTAFYDPDEIRTASHRLIRLRQTRDTVAYTSEFRELVAVLGWTEEAQLMNRYYEGLKGHVKDMLLGVAKPATLDALITTSIECDKRYWERQMDKKEEHSSPSTKPPKPTPRNPPPSSTTSASPSAPTPAPRDPNAMDIGANNRRLSTEERKRRLANNLCLYCGQAGHRKDAHFSSTPIIAATVAATNTGTESQEGAGEANKDF